MTGRIEGCGTALLGKGMSASEVTWKVRPLVSSFEGCLTSRFQLKLGHANKFTSSAS
jgi:hypothetical protein